MESLGLAGWLQYRKLGFNGSVFVLRAGWEAPGLRGVGLAPLRQWVGGIPIPWDEVNSQYYLPT